MQPASKQEDWRKSVHKCMLITRPFLHPGMRSLPVGSSHSKLWGSVGKGGVRGCLAESMRVGRGEGAESSRCCCSFHTLLSGKICHFHWPLQVTSWESQSFQIPARMNLEIRIGSIQATKANESPSDKNKRQSTLSSLGVSLTHFSLSFLLAGHQRYLEQVSGWIVLLPASGMSEELLFHFIKMFLLKNRVTDFVGYNELLENI